MLCLFRAVAPAVVLSLFPFNQSQSADTAPSNRYRWPGGVIPYVIDPDVPRTERIYGAILQWTDLTPIRLGPRNNQSKYVPVVRENKDRLCFSSSGMIGGA